VRRLQADHVKRFPIIAVLLLGAALPAASLPQFKLAWTSKTGDWIRGVVIAPWGDVVSCGADRLRVHARDTGQILDEIAVPWVVEDGLGFTGETKAALVCEDGIYEVSFPGGSAVLAVKLEARSVAAAVEGNRVAAADETGAVRVFDSGSWKAVDSFKTSGVVTALALSPSGDRLAVGLDDGRILMRGLAAKKTKTFYSGGDDHRVECAAFSGDGGQLFADSGVFKASLWDLDSASVSHTYETGSWVVGAEFLSPDLVAACGSDGLVLYRGDGKPALALTYGKDAFPPAVEGLDASPDGKLLCGGDRDGVVACFATEVVGVSGYAALAAPASSGPAPATAGSQKAGLPSAELLGEIQGKKGKVVTVKVYVPAAPAAGSPCAVYKYVEKKLGSFQTSGWLEIASARVKKGEGKKLVLDLVEELGVIVVGGKKVNHFKTGTKVKVACTPP
jgi:hypothetical protein